MMQVNQIVCGDCLEVMKDWPDESINCCISSPPYWALRDYGVEGQLGLEKTFEEYIDKLCTIYDEVWRVLRKDGCCFVNLGDTYGGSGGDSGKTGPVRTLSGIDRRPLSMSTQGNQQSTKHLQKSLCLIPQRFAIEMVNRGWILRNVVVWHKPNPMPSSAKDRFTVDFEYVFFFVKSNETLFWVRPDGVMVGRQPDYKSGEQGLDWTWGIRKGKRVKSSLWKGYCYWFEPQYEPFLTESNAERPRMGQGNQTKYKQKRQYSGTAFEKGVADKKGGWHEYEQEGRMHNNPLGRNKRTVWTIPTQAFPDCHFATFPEKLVEPMIKAGCPEFVCKKCGKGREKIYEASGGTIGKDWNQNRRGIKDGEDLTKGAKTDPKIGDGTYKRTFKGYTDCGCRAGWRPGIVLDLFCRQRNCRQGRRPVAA